MHPTQLSTARARAALFASTSLPIAAASSAQPIAAKGAEPAPRAASAALEQRGCQPEAGTRRNAHLAGASELGHGVTRLPAADAGVSPSRSTFLAVLARQKTIADAVRDGDIQVDGDPRRVAEPSAMLDDANPAFPIVEPK